MNKNISIIVLMIISFTTYANNTVSQAKRIEEVFNNLRADNLIILDTFYDSNVTFIDPLGSHRGLDSIKKYYQNLYQTVKEIKFETVNFVSQGNTHVYLWRMRLSTPSLNNGKEVIVEGNSFITFNDKNLVIYHRDYFDMGEFVYQHIPVLGFFIRKVNERMREE